jgi:hypothetical protein
MSCSSHGFHLGAPSTRWSSGVGLLRTRKINNYSTAQEGQIKGIVSRDFLYVFFFLIYLQPCKYSYIAYIYHFQNRNLFTVYPIAYVFWYHSIALKFLHLLSLFICFLNFVFVSNFWIFASRRSELNLWVELGYYVPMRGYKWSC